MLRAQKRYDYIQKSRSLSPNYPVSKKNKIKLKYEIVDRGKLTEAIDGVKTNKNFYKDQVKTQQ